MAVVIEQSIPIADRYKIFLKLFSILYSINLSEREIDILNDFCLHENGVINQESRRRAGKRLNISYYNITNYLMKLRLRNMVKKEGINEKVLINIMPADKVFSIIFNLTS